MKEGSVMEKKLLILHQFPTHAYIEINGEKKLLSVEAAKRYKKAMDGRGAACMKFPETQETLTINCYYKRS